MTAPRVSTTRKRGADGTLCGKNLRWTAVALARKMREERERLSTHVCDEVAADAAAEMRAMFPAKDASAVERNTRRRVYDALKVMVALGCIAKVGKSLRWVGATPVPSNDKATAAAADAVKMARVSVGAKRRQARELAAQLAAFDALKHRRKDVGEQAAVNFPFVLVAGATAVQTATDEQRACVTLSFAAPFALYTETDIVALLAPRSKARGPRARRPPAPVPRRGRGRPRAGEADGKTAALETSPATTVVHGAAASEIEESGAPEQRNGDETRGLG